MTPAKARQKPEAPPKPRRKGNSRPTPPPAATGPPAAWERQPGETPAAYRAFATYRDLGPDRTIAAAYRQRYGKRTATQPGWFGEWSSRHAWVERAAAYDDHRDALERAERERVWAERAAKVAEIEWDAGQQLLDRAREMLAFPLVEQRLTKDGQTVIVFPSKWKAADARSYVEAATKLLRMATGKPTDTTALTGADGGPVQHQHASIPDLSGLTDEQLEQFRHLLATAAAADVDDA